MFTSILKYSLTATCLLLFLIQSGFASVSCPDTSKALTPAPLEEVWAIEWWMPRHEQKLTEEGRESAKLLFLGDSITHGWERAGNEYWQETFAPFGAHNIGFSGDRTENVLWRLQHGAVDGLYPDVAILMIGTNNTGHRQDSPDCTTLGIERILDELQERLPETRILLLAIFPRSATPNDELRALNEQINSQIEAFQDRELVTFLNINHIFLDEEGILHEDVMPDLLHPNAYGYELWVNAIYPHLIELLEN